MRSAIIFTLFTVFCLMKTAVAYYSDGQWLETEDGENYDVTRDMDHPEVKDDWVFKERTKNSMLKYLGMKCFSDWDCEQRATCMAGKVGYCARDKLCQCIGVLRSKTFDYTEYPDYDIYPLREIPRVKQRDYRTELRSRKPKYFPWYYLTPDSEY